MATTQTTTLDFDTWLEKVNDLCIQTFGVGRDDLPDQDYASAYEDGLTPMDMVEQMEEDLD